MTRQCCFFVCSLSRHWVPCRLCHCLKATKFCASNHNLYCRPTYGFREARRDVNDIVGTIIVWSSYSSVCHYHRGIASPTNIRNSHVQYDAAWFGRCYLRVSVWADVYRRVPMCIDVYRCVTICHSCVCINVWRSVPICIVVYPHVPMCTDVYRCVAMRTYMCRCISIFLTNKLSPLLPPQPSMMQEGTRFFCNVRANVQNCTAPQYSDCRKQFYLQKLPWGTTGSLLIA
jgi:hypothetical protein